MFAKCYKKLKQSNPHGKFKSFGYSSPNADIATQPFTKLPKFYSEFLTSGNEDESDKKPTICNIESKIDTSDAD